MIKQCDEEDELDLMHTGLRLGQPTGRFTTLVGLSIFHFTVSVIAASSSSGPQVHTVGFLVDCVAGFDMYSS